MDDPQNSRYQDLPFDWTKDLTVRLLDRFKDLPCLWDSNHQDYKKRAVKAEAYDDLLEHMRVVNSACDIESIKKKINTLRSQFRKEERMTEESRKSGGEIYESKLWCFPLLKFLGDAGGGSGGGEGENQQDNVNTMDFLQLSTAENDHIEMPQYPSTTQSMENAPNITAKMEQVPIAMYSNLPFEWTKELSLHLIEKYKELRCLWDVKCEDYKNRNLKAEAYELLTKHMMPLNSNCTVEVIKKKINTLRTQYRKEVRMLADNHKKPIYMQYKPKLWCFDDLGFLTDDDLQEEETSIIDLLKGAKEEEEKSALEECKKRTVDATQRLMEYALNELQSKSKSAKEEIVNDDAYHTGKLVEKELRAMDSHQRLFAKKLISDVIYLSNLHRLSFESHIVCGQPERVPQQDGMAHHNNVKPHYHEQYYGHEHK